MTAAKQTGVSPRQVAQESAPLARAVGGVTLEPMNLAARLHENLESVRSEIADAAYRSGRESSEITLVAVTKSQEPVLLREIFALGISDFGENYPQSLWGKASDLGVAAVRWHLIGHLQSNKLARTVPLVHMIHSVDSLKLLRALDAMNVANPPQVCLQVNCSGEAAKHGWSPASLMDDADAISACRNVSIVGLMTMARLDADERVARASFAHARELKGQLAEVTGLVLPHLSMGMSSDYQSAIAEGATIVRIGSALFEGLVG